MLPATDTPLVRLGNLFPDRHVYAKCEHLALSGSFKIRGTKHLLEHLTRESQTRQLVVPSMGNTALGVAVGAPAYGFTVTGVVPQTISRAKDEKLKALGVELVKIPGGGSDLLSHATRLAAERGAYFVHPHLDRLWTDGYQAIAAEVLRDLPDCRSIAIPVGGGGLLMGVTEYFLRHSSPVKVIGCEPYNFPTYARYSHARSKTIADGLLLDIPHAKVQQRIDDLGIPIHLLTEEAIRKSLRGLYRKQGMVVEPSSAITLAAVEALADGLDEPVCAILTGENITREDFFQLLATEER